MFLILCVRHGYYQHLPQTAILPAQRYARAGINRHHMSVRLSVCQSVCLSHAGIVTKRLNA